MMVMRGLFFSMVDQRRHQAESVIVGPVPAQHAVALLEFHIDPLYAAALRPVIKIMKRMFKIKSRPDLVRRAAAPLDPIFESDIRRVFDAFGFLQRRADDASSRRPKSPPCRRIRSACSRTTHLPPARATSMAAGIPAPPPPMIATSVSMIDPAICISLQDLDDRRCIILVAARSNRLRRVYKSVQKNFFKRSSRSKRFRRE